MTFPVVWVCWLRFLSASVVFFFFFFKIFLLGVVFFLWVLYRCYPINLSLAMLPMKNMHSYFCFSVTCSFPLAAFKIFFGQFIIYLSITFFMFLRLWFVGLPETAFTNLGNFPAVISSSVFSVPLPHFSLQGPQSLVNWVLKVPEFLPPF